MDTPKAKILLVTDFGKDIELVPDSGGKAFVVPRFGAWAQDYRGKLEVVDTAGTLEELESRHGKLPPPRQLLNMPDSPQKRAGSMSFGTLIDIS